MQRAITTSQYIAANDFDSAQKIVSANGLGLAMNTSDLANKLKQAAISSPEAMNQALLVHPDRALIIASITDIEKSEITGSHSHNTNFSTMERFNNVTGAGCGCGGTCGGAKLNVDGVTATTTVIPSPSKAKEYIPALLITAIAAIAITVILKN